VQYAGFDGQLEADTPLRRLAGLQRRPGSHPDGLGAIALWPTPSDFANTPVANGLYIYTVTAKSKGKSQTQSAQVFIMK